MRKAIEDMTASCASTMARDDSEAVRLFAQPIPPFLPILPPPDSDRRLRTLLLSDGLYAPDLPGSGANATGLPTLATSAAG